MNSLPTKPPARTTAHQVSDVGYMEVIKATGMCHKNSDGGLTM